MNNIEFLIDKLCPNGVEFRNLGEILDYEQPTKYIVKTTDYNDEFSTPVLTAGQSFILGYTDGKFGIYTANKNNACIIFDDFTTSFHWVDFDFKVKSSALKILKPFISCENEINFKFVFYAMKCVLFNLAEHSRNWISKYSKIKIPIPPLEIQHEIVRILDSFTQLQAELQARKKQYAYYRNKLLSIKELQKRSNDVKMMNLGEIGTFIRGNGLQKKDFVESGIPCIHYGEIYTYYQTCTYSTKSFVSSDVAKKLKKAKYGDLVIAGVSENIDDVCKALVYLGEQEACISGDAFCFSHSQNPKFISYLFQTDDFFKYKKKYAYGTKVIRVHIDKLKSFKIPIPPIEIQYEIVRILDSFTQLQAESQQKSQHDKNNTNIIAKNF